MAMAMFSMVIMVGPAVGPVLGGWITDNCSWPWIFYVNLPVGILGILMTLRNVHEPADVRVANRARAEVAKKNLDIAGIMLMAIAIGALQYVFEEGPPDDWFDSPEILIATFVAGVALVAFVIRELTATAPVVDLRLFSDPTFASATLIAVVVFAMLMGSMFLLPVFTQEMLHYTATQSGIVLMPRTLAMMARRRSSAGSTTRSRRRILVGVGVLLFALGMLEFSDITLATAATEMIVPLVDHRRRRSRSCSCR